MELKIKTKRALLKELFILVEHFLFIERIDYIKILHETGQLFVTLINAKLIKSVVKYTKFS